MASGKQDFATDWKSIGRNAERIEAITLRGPGAGRVDLIARGIWPRWSPTDNRLAFVASDGGNWDLYLRSADGLVLTRLTDDPATDTFPVWTHDGAEVAFLSDRGNRWDLYKVPATGGAPSRLTNHSRREDQADLSPDGRLVAFTERPGRPESRIWILDLARGSVRPLLGGSQGERDPSWSPDGRSLAFVSRRPSPLLPIQQAP
jgi:TolB protein